MVLPSVEVAISVMEVLLGYLQKRAPEQTKRVFTQTMHGFTKVDSWRDIEVDRDEVVTEDVPYEARVVYLVSEVASTWSSEDG